MMLSHLAAAKEYTHADAIQLLQALNTDSISVPIDHEYTFERCYVRITENRSQMRVHYHTTANRIVGFFIIEKSPKPNTLLQATNLASDSIRLDYTEVRPFGPSEDNTVRLSILTAANSIKEFRVFSTHPARVQRLECYF